MFIFEIMNISRIGYFWAMVCFFSSTIDAGREAHKPFVNTQKKVRE